MTTRTLTYSTVTPDKTRTNGYELEASRRLPAVVVQWKRTQSRVRQTEAEQEQNNQGWGKEGGEKDKVLGVVGKLRGWAM